MASWQQTVTATAVLGLGLVAFGMTAIGGGTAAPVAGPVRPLGDEPVAEPTGPALRFERASHVRAAEATLSGEPITDADAAARTPAAPGGGGSATAKARPVGSVTVHADGDARALCTAEVLADLRYGRFGTAATVELTSSRHVVQRVADGRAAIGLIARDLAANERRLEVGSVELGSYVPALVAHRDNPLRNLRSRDLRALLRGSITDWSQLGGSPGPIRLVTPADDETRALVARALIPGDALAVTADAAVDDERALAIARSDRSALAIVALPVAELERVTPLTIDGVPPSVSARRRGTYPYGASLHLVHARLDDPAVERLVQRFREADGPFARRLAR